MAIDKLKSEKDFLIGLAIDQFNRQYGRKLTVAECTIKSLKPDYDTELGYEITTLTTADYLTLRIYLSQGRLDELYRFRLETTNTQVVQQLGDEVYVAIGSVNRYYVDAGIYRFRWIEGAPVADEAMRFMDGDPFVLMNGEGLSFIEQR